VNYPLCAGLLDASSEVHVRRKMSMSQLFHPRAGGLLCLFALCGPLWIVLLTLLASVFTR
jgi:hypothetical protein